MERTEESRDTYEMELILWRLNIKTQASKSLAITEVKKNSINTRFHTLDAWLLQLTQKV